MDKEKLLKLLQSFGLEPESNNNNITLEEGQQKVDGYSGFFIYFTFDNNGNFINCGIWEQ